MTRFLRHGVSVIVAAIVVAGPFYPGRGLAAAARHDVVTPAGWHLVYRSWSRGSNQIYDVAAVSAGNAWAVGARTGASGLQDQPLVLRWNGAQWRTVSIPAVAGFYLPSVQARSRSDVWIFAVSDKDGHAKAVHWDGSRWHSLPLPGGVYPDDAVVLGPSNAWVVGPSGCTGNRASRRCQTMLYHWTGRMWGVSSVPIVVDQLSGAALSASGPRNVWLVGADGPCAAAPCSYRVDAYRWNGRTWRRVLGMPAVRSYHLPGVTVTGHDVWVGTWATRAGHPGRLLHRNSSGWHQISAPLAVATGTPLIADGHGGVWMGPWARWTGKHWINAVPAANAGCDDLQSLARFPGTTTLWGGGATARAPRSHVFDSVICRYPKVP